MYEIGTRSFFPTTYSNIYREFALGSYKPVSSLSDEAPIDFVVPGHGDEYIDLAHTMLSIKVKILPVSDAHTEEVGPVNNFMHSLFSQIDINFNQKPISPPNNAYPYRAYIESLLNYGPDAKESHLSTVM